jgi:uncharacterized protein (DUF433 family)
MTNKNFELGKSFFEECSLGHPLIIVDPGVFKGIPHVKGTRLSVSEILSRIYVHRSVAAVVHYYGDITEEQVREAVSYAGKFIESAFAGLSEVQK